MMKSLDLRDRTVSIRWCLFIETLTVEVEVEVEERTSLLGVVVTGAARLPVVAQTVR